MSLWSWIFGNESKTEEQQAPTPQPTTSETPAPAVPSTPGTTPVVSQSDVAGATMDPASRAWMDQLPARAQEQDPRGAGDAPSGGMGEYDKTEAYERERARQGQDPYRTPGYNGPTPPPTPAAPPPRQIDFEKLQREQQARAYGNQRRSLFE